jgi:cytochrome P450
MTPTTLSVDQIDLSDLEFWKRPDREGAFAKLRAERPVAFMKEFVIPGLEMPPGPGYWAVTRYSDVWHVSRHPEDFTSGQGIQIPDIPVRIGSIAPAASGSARRPPPCCAAGRREVARAAAASGPSS